MMDARTLSTQRLSARDLAHFFPPAGDAAASPPLPADPPQLSSPEAVQTATRRSSPTRVSFADPAVESNAGPSSVRAAYEASVERERALQQMTLADQDELQVHHSETRTDTTDPMANPSSGVSSLSSPSRVLGARGGSVGGSPSSAAGVVPLPGALSTLFDRFRAKQTSTEAPASNHATRATVTTQSVTTRIFATQSTRASPTRTPQQTATPRGATTMRQPHPTQASAHSYATPMPAATSGSSFFSHSRPPSSSPEFWSASRADAHRAHPFADAHSPTRRTHTMPPAINATALHEPLLSGRFTTSARSPSPTKPLFGSVSATPAAAAASTHASSQHISQMIAEKDAQLAASISAQSQLEVTVSRLSSELESLHAQLSESTAAHEDSLQHLRAAHQAEIESVQHRAASQLSAREAQLAAVDEARVQASEAAAEALEQERLRAAEELAHERALAESELARREERIIAQQRDAEQQAARWSDECAAAEVRAQHAADEKERNWTELVAETERLCAERAQELEARSTQRDADAQHRLAALEAELKRAYATREAQLEREFARREAELVRAQTEADAQRQAQSDALAEAEHEFHSTQASRRQALESEWKESERALFAKFRERETTLSADYAEKLGALEQERARILDTYAEQQRNIDAGNEAKLRAIVGNYKQRIGELEKAVDEAVTAKMQTGDQAILAAVEASKRRAEFEGVVDSYKVLIGEQTKELELLRASNDSLKGDLASIQVTYEELIGRLGEAQSLKVQQAQHESATLRHGASHAERSLAAASAEATALREAHVAMQQSFAALEIDHARLVASLQIAAESKALAEDEAARLRLESRRQTKEMERLEKIVYGHSGGQSSRQRNSGGGTTAANSTSSIASVTAPTARRSTTTTRQTRIITMTSSPGAAPSTTVRSLPPTVTTTEGDTIDPHATSLQFSDSAHVDHAAAHSQTRPLASLYARGEPEVDFASALAHGTRDDDGAAMRTPLARTRLSTY